MLHKHIIFTNFSDWRFNFTKASGSYIWDEKGKKYIDFTSGWNVVNLGWNNEEIVNAGLEQMKVNTYVPMWAMGPTQEKYAENLVKALGRNLEFIGRANCGVEAIEMAIKTVRVYTGKKKIISFLGQFHGSSINALSFSYRPEWMAKMTDPRADVVQLEYPNMYRTDKTSEQLLSDTKNKLEEVLAKGDVAALITEAGMITGWGSAYVAPDGFLTMICKLTKKYNALLILDEVGTGFGRTGTMWGMERENVSPDVVILAKAIANGSVPIAAMVTTKEIAEATFAGSNLQSTFGWNPVACAMADKTLEIHLRNKTWEMARRKGEYVRKIINQELGDNPFFGEIRGWGLENGIDLVKDKFTKEGNGGLAKKVVQETFDQGLHAVADASGVVLIMPPLTIRQKDLDAGLEILISTINKL